MTMTQEYVKQFLLRGLNSTLIFPPLERISRELWNSLGNDLIYIIEFARGNVRPAIWGDAKQGFHCQCSIFSKEARPAGMRIGYEYPPCTNGLGIEGTTADSDVLFLSWRLQRLYAKTCRYCKLERDLICRSRCHWGDSISTWNERRRAYMRTELVQFRLQIGTLNWEMHSSLHVVVDVQSVEQLQLIVALCQSSTLGFRFFLLVPKNLNFNQVLIHPAQEVD